ncbi:MAG: macrolide ABC transporter ATP-binding protein [Gammaproteobacteria bacterium SG8_11]|nr:MAG: macrolide ABC transporter ATP-binding protein [Gammaproteobacteria bacterium SG8_11]
MIELQQINRIFTVGDQQVHALDNVDLSIHPGEYLSIMGPSGSGKSTLLNIIGLLDRPTSGTYLLEQQNVTSMNDDTLAHTRRNKIGFVFQFFQLLPRLTALENVELPMVLEGVAPDERRKAATDTLTSMGLADRLHHRPDQLSGGQRQRVAIARATIMKPAVILADEPTGNLDRHSGKEVIELLEQLNKTNITLIIVTHDPEIGLRAARQIRMVDGKVMEDNNKT